jgi:CHAD domain-containing protein
MRQAKSKPTQLDPKQLLLQALDTRWENYYLELENCRAEFSNEAVHDLRVATRRILALIRLLNTVTPQPRLKKLSRAFKEQLDQFDDLRDTQVILEELIKILPELPQLDDFHEQLLQAEGEMLQVLGQQLKERDMDSIADRVQKTRATIAAGSPDGLQPLILDAVDDAFLVTRQRLGWVDLDRSATIHRVRVAFKAFRYMVEIAHPLLPNFPVEKLKKMNVYQTLMGNIQDAEVFAQSFIQYSGHTPVADLALVRCYYEERRAGAIAAFIGAKERLHTFWRPAADRQFPWEKI